MCPGCGEIQNHKDLGLLTIRGPSLCAVDPSPWSQGRNNETQGDVLPQALSPSKDAQTDHSLSSKGRAGIWKIPQQSPFMLPFPGGKVTAACLGRSLRALNCL